MIVSVPKKKFEELSSKGFSVKIKGKVVKGFVTQKNGQFYAYLNLCKHLPVTLDLNDENFFTFDKTHFQCHMHGAMYEIETGFCVAGPCQGARLDALEITEEESRLLISVPESAAETK
jgi:nitrite reductase/ring-hydroxylating ferredoxin subunit